MQRGRLPKARARGGAFFKVGLTSVREELSVDLLEGLLVDHAAGALLREGTESAGGVCGAGRLGPALGSGVPRDLWWAGTSLSPRWAAGKQPQA